MGIFTSQKRNLQDLPKPSEFDFGSVKGISLPEVKEEVSSVPELSEKDVNVKKQVFIKMDHYKEALDTVTKIKNKIKDADMVLNDLRNMKAKEDEHLIKWHNDLEDIKKRLNKMDEVLYDIENE
tara:strand:- start:1569 stop:1940 length:372 start_codon:yes stop_codon:yes gene_type:complete